MALRTLFDTVAVPDLPDLQPGGQSGTMTLPDVPRLPMWMWAATAAPLRPLNVRFHVSLLPTSLRVNVPVAPAGTPCGFGTSCPAVSLADSFLAPPIFVAPRPIETA